MDAARFRWCLSKLDWSQRKLARTLEVNFATVQRWSRDQQPVPPEIAIWLETLALSHAENPVPPPPE
jgi:plasmid maintenance system antidote protein VapI